MYYDEGNTATFQPHINKASQHLTIAPLQCRSSKVMEEMMSRKAQLQVQAEEAFHATSTFRPSIDKVSEQLAANRVPLAERTNQSKPSQKFVDPEATHKPKINETSKKMLSSQAREAQHAAMEVKRKVRDLWVRHAEGGGQMIRSEAVATLNDLGILETDPIGKKFLMAFGFDHGGARYVEFPRFSSVLTAAFQTAAVKPSDDVGPQPKLSAASAGQNASGAVNTSRNKDFIQQLANGPAVPQSAPTTPVKFDVNSSRQAPQSARPRAEKLQFTSSALSEDVSMSPEAKPMRSSSVSTKSRRVTISPTVSVATPRQSGRYSDRIEDEKPQDQRRPLAAKASAKAASVSQPTTNMIPTFNVPSRFSQPKPKTNLPTAEEEALKQCSFKPNINSTMVTGPKREEPVSKAPLLTSEERAAAQCTFAPKTNKHPPSTARCSVEDPLAVARSLPGFEKTVQRLAAGRSMAVPKFEESLRGSSERNHQDSTSPQNSHGETHVKPFHLRSERRREEREKPMLFVDVDMAHGKHGRIGVHRGDKPETLAHNFARLYSLDYVTEQKLVDLLRQKIRAALEAEQSRSLWV